MFGYTARPQARGPVVRPARQRPRHAQVQGDRPGLHLGRRPPPARAVARHGHLRDCTCAASPCAIPTCRRRCAAPTPGSRPRPVDRLPEAPRRHDGRADAGARLRRRPPPGRARACATTGATTRSASSRPDPRYSASGKVTEFKTMVKTLHSAGIEVILDVVYNHTAEGNQLGPDAVASAASTTPPTTACTPDDRALLRRLHRLRQHAQHAHPRVLQLIMDSLRYWVTEMHVDGFRFDLASTLARELHEVEPAGRLLRHPAPGPGADPGQADRRAVGPRRGRLPGRQLPAGLGRVERQVPRHHARLLEGRRRPDRRVRAAPHRLERPLRPQRPPAAREHQLRHRARRLHAARPRLATTRSTTRPTARTTATATTTTCRGTAAPKGRPTIPRSRALRARQQAQPARHAAAVAGRADAARRRRDRPHASAATTTPTARTTRSAGSTGTCDEDERALLAFAQRLIALRRAHPVFRRRDFFQGRPLRGSAVKDIAWLKPDGAEMTRRGVEPGLRALPRRVPRRRGARRDRRTRPTACATTSFLLLFNAHHERDPLPAAASWARHAWQPAARHGRRPTASPRCRRLPPATPTAAGPLARAAAARQGARHETPASPCRSAPTLRDDGSTRFRLWAPRAHEVAVELVLRPRSAPRHGARARAATAGSRRASPASARAPATPFASTAGAGARPGLALQSGRRARRRAWWSIRSPSTGATRLARPAVARGRDLRAARRHLHPRGHLRGAIDRLDHLAALGVTAIELMPVADFPGRRNWGYDGVLPFAPDASYGTPGRSEAPRRRRARARADGAARRRLQPLRPGRQLPARATRPQFFNRRTTRPGARRSTSTATTAAPCATSSSTTRSTGSRSSTSTACASTPCTRSPTTRRRTSSTSSPRAVRDAARAASATCTSCSRTTTTRRAISRATRGPAAARDRAVERRRAPRAARAADRRDATATTPTTPTTRCAQLGRALAEGFAYQGEPSAFRGGERAASRARALPPHAFVNFLQNHDQVGNRAFGERIAALADADARARRRRLPAAGAVAAAAVHGRGVRAPARRSCSSATSARSSRPR